jgi:hypothetical protein
MSERQTKYSFLVCHKENLNKLKRQENTKYTAALQKNECEMELCFFFTVPPKSLLLNGNFFGAQKLFS